MHPSLNGFTAYRQFIIYRLVPKANGKADKLPCDYRTGKVASAHDPAIWTDSATAEATAAAWGGEWGVGFVFTESDPFFFLDIDSCLVDGAWSPLATGLCGALSGCAVEVSASGTGLHIFGSGKPPVHGCRNAELGLEFYSSGRFVALTGAGAVGNCLADASAVLPALVAQYFPPDVSTLSDVGWTSGPVPEWNGPKDDAALLMKAMRPSPTSAFTGKAGFADLWTANEAALSKSYPDAGGRSYDASAADAALAQHLAFWTGRDGERIERLMRQSALCRDKWDSHTTYLREFTIQGAVDRQESVFGDRATSAPNSAPGAALAEPLASGIVLRRLSEVTPKNVVWLWNTWLPLGMFALFAGPGGVGKSTVTLSWAATTSTGSKWPDGSNCKPGKVLIWSGEDDTATTIVPRLMSMGANLEHIRVIEGRRTVTGEPIPFDPARDFPELCKQVKEEGVSLLIIDPIVSTVSGDMNKANEVRKGLQAIVDFAEEVNCCVVGITHFAKNSSGKNPTDRVIGSQAFSAFARMVLVSQKDEENGECVLVRSKSNISIDRGGFRYRIEPTTLRVAAGAIETTRAHWLMASEGSARELLEEVEPVEERITKGKIEEAKSFLSVALSKGPRPIKQLEVDSGISFRTMSRAKKELGIISQQKRDGWYWSLPIKAESVGLHRVDGILKPYTAE
jgi:hypothetical protein